MKLVVDASVIGKAWVKEDGTAKAKELLVAAAEGHHELLAPAHMLAEVCNIFVKHRRVREDRQVALTPATIGRYVGAVMDVIRAEAVMVMQGEDVWMRAAVRMASLDTKGQGNLSIYDTMYHALSRYQRALFLTADAAYLRKLQHHERLRSSVVLLDDFAV